MPLPQLLYAQVVKTVRRRRLVRVSHRVVFGTLEAVEQVLAACGWQINTAFVERLNLDSRAACGGSRAACHHAVQGKDGMRHQLVLFHAYHNFCLPHASLRASGGACPDQRHGLRHAVAAADAGHGRGAHRSRLDAARGTTLPGPTVAAASGRVSQQGGRKWHGEAA